jgi:hypothetical protein
VGAAVAADHHLGPAAGDEVCEVEVFTIQLPERVVEHDVDVRDDRQGGAGLDHADALLGQERRDARDHTA